MGMVDWDALIVNGMIAKDPALESKRDDFSFTPVLKHIVT
jgi:phosphate transport system permease protein